MLESMTHNIRPTRAEIADVANAVYDGTSAIMLSGETAAGEHPVEALSAMARIAEYTEAHINYAKRFPKTQFEIHDTLDAISHATCGMAIDIGAKVITVCSITGRTARLISRFRGPTDIIGLTTNERAYRKLALSWGITPVMSEVYESTDVLFYHALQVSRKVMQLEKGDKVIITGGIITGRSGHTHTIKVEYAEGGRGVRRVRSAPRHTAAPRPAGQPQHAAPKGRPWRAAVERAGKPPENTPGFPAPRENLRAGLVIMRYVYIMIFT